ncbi:hypothetical protein PG991_015909 [Apiospora marii]|uniref:Uncharacterized protein n=1 Tax=Apiospora marii TaxID=335849 RepID=A0ABR1R092_9PEZI
MFLPASVEFLDNTVGIMGVKANERLEPLEARQVSLDGAAERAEVYMDDAHDQKAKYDLVDTLRKHNISITPAANHSLHLVDSLPEHGPGRG